MPLFPFHTWLPDAYQTAPTGVSMVLTGVLSKMGVYGFVRLLLPLFPNEIRIIGPVAACAGGLLDCFRSAGSMGAARFETNGRLLVSQPSRLLHARSCLQSLPRPLLLQIDTQAALSGVFMQIFNHGITAAALFYFVGLLEQRRGSAWHRRLRRTDAADAAALRLDERRHVFVARFAGAERISSASF